MAVLPARFGWIAIGLVLLAGFGFALTAARTPAPAALPLADSPGCDSCDARHARLADLRAQTAAGAE